MKCTIEMVIQASCLSALFSGTAICPSGMAQTDGAVVQIEQLSRSQEVDPKMLWTSPDGSRWAHAARRGSRMVMVVDGRDVGPYSAIASVPFRIPGEEHFKDYQKRPGGAFTPDGKVFVFTAQQGDQVHVVTVGADGVREGPPLSQKERILEIIMPPAGHRYAVLHQIQTLDRYGRPKIGARLVVDGRNSPDFAVIDQKSILFTADGRHISYVAMQDIADPSSKSPLNKRVYHTVIDQTPGPQFGFIFNSNGQKGRCNHLVLSDGVPTALYFTGKSMGRTGELVLQSPDGKVKRMSVGIDPSSVVLTADAKHWAGVQVTPLKQTDPREPPSFRHVVHLDAKPVATYDGARVENLTISPDGTRSAFSGVSTRNVVQPVIDGKAGLDYRRAGDYTFSPDSKRLAYVAENGGEQFLVLDGKEYGPYGDVSRIVFSPDGQRAAWAARVDVYSTRAFLEGKPGPDVPNPGIAWMTFSPADGQLVYMGGHVDVSGSMDSRVVYFGLAGDQSFPAASPPQVTPDGKHLAFLGRNRQKQGSGSAPTEPPFFVYDGRKLPILDTVEESGLTFASSGQFVASAGRNNFAQREQGFSINGALVLPLIDAPGPPRIADGRASVLGVTQDGQLVRVSADMRQFAGFRTRAEQADNAAGFRSLHTFAGGDAGDSPVGSLVLHDQMLYGLATGGRYKAGIVYRINCDGSGFKVLQALVNDSPNPMAPTSLVFSRDGWLYGTAVRGSSYEGAWLFRLRPDGSDFETIAKADRDAAYYFLCLAGDDGSVYGIKGGQRDGGRQGDAVKIAPDGSISVLARAEAGSELAAFRDGADGYFYGNMRTGPYRLAKAGGAPQQLHRFRGSPLDGRSTIDWDIWPPALLGANALIGHADGGERGEGVIYQMQRDGSDYQVRHLEAQKETTVRRIIGAHQDAVYGLVYNRRALARAQQQAELVKINDGRLESVATIPLIPTVPPTLAADGSAMYGQARRQVFRINLATVAKPTLAKTDTPHREQAPWPIQQVEYVAFNGPLPGAADTAVASAQADQSPQPQNQQSAPQGSEQQAVEQRTGEAEPAQPVDGALGQVEETKQKVNRVRKLLGW